jgi:hypothetical protein
VIYAKISYELILQKKFTESIIMLFISAAISIKWKHLYYVKEYTLTCRFLEIINLTLTGLVDYFFSESTVGVLFIT